MESDEKDPFEIFRITLSDGSEVYWNPKQLAGYDLEKYRRLKMEGKTAREIAAEARAEGLLIGKGPRSFGFAHQILVYLLGFDKKTAKEAIVIEFGWAKSLHEHEGNIAEQLRDVDM